MIVFLWTKMSWKDFILKTSVEISYYGRIIILNYFTTFLIAKTIWWREKPYLSLNRYKEEFIEIVLAGLFNRKASQLTPFNLTQTNMLYKLYILRFLFFFSPTQNNYFNRNVCNIYHIHIMYSTASLTQVI